MDIEVHALTRGMLLLRSLGIFTDEIEYNLPVLDSDRLKIEVLLKKHNIENDKMLIAVNPEATWKTKLWNNDKFAELADRLTDMYDARTIFTGGPARLGRIIMWSGRIFTAVHALKGSVKPWSA